MEDKKLNDKNNREYKSDDLIVYWYPSICSHAQKCWRTLPQVFDTKKRPWVTIDGADPLDIIRTVDICPSGALRYALTENSKVDPRLANGPGSMEYTASQAETVNIRVVKDGPLLVKGPARLIDPEGNVLREGDSMVLCRCGKTKNPPFCDGEHRKNK
ncbi:MAG: (4Fe-4S)-binding protein [Eubacteriales bacterium]|nr:(4Fe-4S)-binding protein [Eubacteriales bacterium]MDD3200235.1 (4Fe-4S)-binding protein [Eubacteriales bacterium]MDD4630495.1 (4Fe-4S)-binding protein [Eubacteriales bacterium]